MTEPTEEDDRRGVGDDDGQAVRHGTMRGIESAGTEAQEKRSCQCRWRYKG